MSTLQIPTAEAFIPLLAPARYKVAYGGRGSGKSQFFSGLLVEECLAHPGLRAVCIREVQKTLRESAKKLIEDKIEEYGVGHQFIIQRDQIITPGAGAILFQGMQDHTAESIKSLEAIDRAWVEEAQTLSERSLTLLRPTIRKPYSEIWFSMNPRRKVDAVDVFFRQKEAPEGSIIVKANWDKNPWFPDVLDAERRHDLNTDPDGYEHTWEGGYATVTRGAYFAKDLALARKQNRIGFVAADPLLPIRTFHDIGGAGATADAYVIWAAQFVGTEIRILNYYESQGQPLAAHVNWMRSQGYESAIVVLPHDGLNTNNVTAMRYADHWRDAGFNVPEPIPNQGRGAAMQRVQAARRLFPRIRFNKDTTETGVESLGWYHAKIDDRGVDLGPDHDWASHCADAFGLMCLVHADQKSQKPLSIPNYGAV